MLVSRIAAPNQNDHPDPKSASTNDVKQQQADLVEEVALALGYGGGLGGGFGGFDMLAICRSLTGSSSRRVALSHRGVDDSYGPHQHPVPAPCQRYRRRRLAPTLRMLFRDRLG
jgi:hypothetical protein